MKVAFSAAKHGSGKGKHYDAPRHLSVDVTESTTSRLIVAEFYKSPRGRLTLCALTTISEGADRGRAYTIRRQYDVDLSRRYGYIYHLSGSGGGNAVEVSGIYFATQGVSIRETPTNLVHATDRPPWRSQKTKVIRERNRTRRLRSLPRSFPLEAGWDLLTWLEYNAINSETVWCSACGDDLPETDLCDHCWWCDETGEWSTPSERCACEPEKGCHA